VGKRPNRKTRGRKGEEKKTETPVAFKPGKRRREDAANRGLIRKGERENRADKTFGGKRNR